MLTSNKLDNINGIGFPNVSRQFWRASIEKSISMHKVNDETIKKSFKIQNATPANQYSNSKIFEKFSKFQQLINKQTPTFIVLPQK